ncbi:MAG: ABC transporter permease [Thaumarchaeota archaeon]|nr:ABC transporter permease [Nitrososphaerota archaeon]
MIIFFVTVTINFILPRLEPGNFAQDYIAQLTRDIHDISPATQQILLQHLTTTFGLDQPVYVQYERYLVQLLSFPPNFGFSFEFYPTPAWQIISIALPWTLLLVGSSQIIAWVIGIVLGVTMATRKGSKFDKLLQPLNISLLTIPAFWLASVFILVFAIYLRILPAATAYDITPTPGSVLLHMILPLSVLVITSVPSHVIVMRSAALEVLQSDFVLAMKAQGLGSRLFLRRVLKNSLLPSLTALFLSFGGIIGGVYVVEFTFSYPGLGGVLANAIFARDYPVLQAALYMTVVVVLLANLAADLLYPLIDPRVSYAR